MCSFTKLFFLFLQDSKETKPYLVDVIKSWLKPKHDSQHFHVSNKQFSKTSQLKCHINKQVFICQKYLTWNKLEIIMWNQPTKYFCWQLQIVSIDITIENSYRQTSIHLPKLIQTWIQKYLAMISLMFLAFYSALIVSSFENIARIRNAVQCNS